VSAWVPPNELASIVGEFGKYCSTGFTPMIPGCGFNECVIADALFEGRLAPKCRLLESFYSPSFAHIASTFALVARSISIIAGQGRSKPSAFHLRVASTPIFDP